MRGREALRPQGKGLGERARKDLVAQLEGRSLARAEPDALSPAGQLAERRLVESCFTPTA